MKKFYKISLFFSLIAVMSLTFSSCATLQDVLKDKENGSHKVYPVNFNTAWKTAMTVLRWEGSETIEQHRSEGYMLTTVGQNLISAGSVVGVWIDKVDSKHSKVTVVTKRKMATNLATGLTETTFLESYGKAVNILKQGKKLPFEKP